MKRNSKNLGIYIHVPFCLKKCPYCDFYSVKYNFNNNLEKQYFNSVINEIKSYKFITKKNKIIVDTVYFGGGTPSIVNLENIKNVLKAIKKVFKIKLQEVTLEANPNSIDEHYLQLLRKIGVDRLSLGMQSANDEELFILGRKHKKDNVKLAIELAKKAGFNNISVDIMLGVPNQNIEKVETTLNFIKSLGVQHISAYMLKIEPNTLFNNKQLIAKLPDEDLTADIYLYVVKRLRDMGYYQYEISNFAIGGYESKHNLKYWNMEDYIGIGPAAHSFYNNKRYSLGRSIYKYIGMAKNNNFNYIQEKQITDINEYIMLKLRTSEGINLGQMKLIYPKELVNEFCENIKKYYNKKYINIDENIVSFTPQGFLIFNTIVTNIMVN